MEFVKGHKYCYCDVPAVVFTSWTATNPGRQFYRCRKYTHKCGCEYFKWLDPEMTNQATNVINGLLRKLDRMESEKRLQYELNGRRKLNGCAVARWSCLVAIVFLFGFIVYK
ncbi:hypothetical protein Syun_025104 [Stephania yunnanensis]|uniref:GRF-type domain-containing protein n=1 Tax=Stephania yunnanensis TaxID=152371 RepID=A0AAP0ERH8_9MAGN